MDTTNKPLDKFPKLQARIDFLIKQKELHFELYKQVLQTDNRNVHLQDQFIIGILKRSLDLLDSLITLINNWHYNISATLIRMQADNLLRIYYSTTRPDIEFYLEFYSGKSFRQIKHTNNKQITDKLLIDIAKPIYPWIEDLYKETSNFLHLSSKHFNTTILSMNKEDRTMESFFGIGQPNCKEQYIDNLLDAFSCTTDAILKIVMGWIITKNKNVNSK